MRTGFKTRMSKADTECAEQQFGSGFPTLTPLENGVVGAPRSVSVLEISLSAEFVIKCEVI
jgi:hypothetical protein